jgi:hypothetical protein
MVNIITANTIIRAPRLNSNKSENPWVIAIINPRNRITQKRI